MIPGDKGTALGNAAENSIASARTSLEYIVNRDEEMGTHVVDDLLAALTDGANIEDSETIRVIRAQGLWDDQSKGLNDEAFAVLGGFVSKNDQDGSPYFDLDTLGM